MRLLTGAALALSLVLHSSYDDCSQRTGISRGLGSAERRRWKPVSDRATARQYVAGRVAVRWRKYRLGERC